MTDQVRNIDKEIEALQKAIELKDAIVRLEKNRDFKKVFTDMYFSEWATNLVMQRGLPEMRSRPELIEANSRKIDAVGELHGFIRGTKAQGNDCELRIKEAEDARASILAEVE